MRCRISAAHCGLQSAQADLGAILHQDLSILAKLRSVDVARSHELLRLYDVSYDWCQTTVFVERALNARRPGGNTPLAYAENPPKTAPLTC